MPADRIASIARPLVEARAPDRLRNDQPAFGNCSQPHTDTLFGKTKFSLLALVDVVASRKPMCAIRGAAVLQAITLNFLPRWSATCTCGPGCGRRIHRGRARSPLGPRSQRRQSPFIPLSGPGFALRHQFRSVRVLWGISPRKPQDRSATKPAFRSSVFGFNKLNCHLTNSPARNNI